MTELELTKFIPFRLNRLAAEVSNKLAEVYTDRFGIDIVEWRILVTLAALKPKESCSAQHIVQSTRTHKSRISRGVNRMIELNYVVRTESRHDRREAKLRLTAKGRSLHSKVAPVVLEQERHIVSCLNEQEMQAFTHALDKLEHSMGLIPQTDDQQD